MEFLSGNPEQADMNQYWYSSHTIAHMVKDITTISAAAAATSSQPVRVAFLSTPSLYFSCPETFREHCHVFDVLYCIVLPSLFLLSSFVNLSFTSLTGNGAPIEASASMTSTLQRRFLLISLTPLIWSSLTRLLSPEM